MDEEFMLTTLDNPFNPFTQYDEWYNYDVSMGYHTCAYLARVTQSSDELSDTDQELSIDEGMNKIVEINIFGNHLKVKKDYVPRLSLVTKE